MRKIWLMIPVLAVVLVAPLAAGADPVDTTDRAAATQAKAEIALVLEQAMKPVARPAMSMQDGADLRKWDQCTEDSHCGSGHKCCFYDSGNRCRKDNIDC